MSFESMNSASILLMLGFAAIMVMFLFVMRSLDNLVKSLREERRVLIGNLDNLSQDIRSIKMNLNQGSSGNQGAAAKSPLSTTQPSHNNMMGTPPVTKPSAPAPGQNVSGQNIHGQSMSGHGSAIPVSGQSSGQLPVLSTNATASSTATGAGKAVKDDFFLDLSLKDTPTPRQSQSSRTKQPGLELKL